ncbi:MAG: ABC transporter permease [Reyranellaceae bacterium]
MRREGSPFTGTGAVFAKEFAEHVGSIRMFIIEALVVVAGTFVVYLSVSDLKSKITQDQFIFLRLFTYAPEGSLTFADLLTFLVPLIAIGLGFDSVNGEFNRRTMSRILSQPIYRDALLIGKFLAGLVTLGTGLTALWLLVIGGGLLVLGVPPSGEELLRGIAFLFIATAYGGIWLAIAMLCSILFRSAATSALAALGLWLFLTFLWPPIGGAIFDILVPYITPRHVLAGGGTADDIASLYETRQVLMRVSPTVLFQEAWLGVFSPDQFTEQQIMRIRLDPRLAHRVIPGSPLSFGQSLLMVWPQFTFMVAGAIVIFTLGYISFQRQEVRA